MRPVPGRAENQALRSLARHRPERMQRAYEEFTTLTISAVRSAGAKTYLRLALPGVALAMALTLGFFPAITSGFVNWDDQGQFLDE